MAQINGPQDLNHNTKLMKSKAPFSACSLWCITLSASLTLVVCADEGWQRHTIDDSSRGADGVRLMDVNGDGLMDIAVPWEQGNMVRAYLHPGHESADQIWPAVTVGNVKSAEDAVFADLDGDGTIDLVSSCEGNTRAMFAHWAPTEKNRYLDPKAWQTERIPACEKQSWMYALPMQIDGKGGIDVVVASKGDGAMIGWLMSPTNPRRLGDWRLSKLQDAGWIMSLIDVDMNHDGRRDILVSDRKGSRRGVYWLENPGSEETLRGNAWRRHDIGGSDREVMFIAVGDLDRDGWQDVIAATRSEIFWCQSLVNGWKTFPIDYPEGVGTGKSAVIVDVNQDGKNDIVFSCENAKGDLSGIRWLSWKQSPTERHWESHEIGGPLGHKYDRIEMYDVDGDGDLDALCCEERDQLGVFWYENPYENQVPAVFK